MNINSLMGYLWVEQLSRETEQECARLKQEAAATHHVLGVKGVHLPNAHAHFSIPLKSQDPEHAKHSLVISSTVITEYMLGVSFLHIH